MGTSSSSDKKTDIPAPADSVQGQAANPGQPVAQQPAKKKSCGWFTG